MSISCLNFLAAAGRQAVLLGLAALALCSTSEAESAPLRTYRCGATQQDKPCTVRVGAASASSFHSGANTPRRERQDSSLRAQLNPSAPYARVLSQHFEGSTTRSTQIRSSMVKTAATSSVPDGRWYGTVEGNGSVHLFLEISRGAQLLERRFMGRIKLIHTRTTFTFVSAIPPSHGWGWRVVAEAV